MKAIKILLLNRKNISVLGVEFSGIDFRQLWQARFMSKPEK